MGKRNGAGSNLGSFFSSSSFCLCMCGNVMKGLFCFLHIVAKSPSAFPK